MAENGTEKIPPIIHYCWFGGNPLPDMARKCIASWRKYCPGYQIIEWNETNFDINYNDYMREAYEAKKWAFVSDVARLYALSAMGGIYMDTDVELLKPLDSLRQYEAVSGFECQTRISTGLMACREGQEMFLEFLSAYNDIHFRLKDGSFDLTPNVTRITDACLKYGLSLDNKKQTVRGFTLLPSEYLCPKNFETLETKITEHTLCIHHFDGSWLSDYGSTVLLDVLMSGGGTSAGTIASCFERFQLRFCPEKTEKYMYMYLMCRLLLASKLALKEKKRERIAKESRAIVEYHRTFYEYIKNISEKKVP